MIDQKLLKELEQLKSPKGFLKAGHPYYLRLFGRDSMIAAWELLDFDPNIAKATLLILAKLQGKKVSKKSEEEPGKILHEHYEEGFKQKLWTFLKTPFILKPLLLIAYLFWKFPYYGAIDGAGLWINLLYEYYQKTKDKKLVEKVWPNLLRALEWTFQYGDKDKDGFIEYKRKNPVGLFHQAWKDALLIYIKPPVAMVEVQAYYYRAYKVALELAKEINREESLEKFNLKQKAEELKEKFNRLFWWEEENYFYFALNGKKKPVKIITSNPGQCIYFEILDDDKREKVVQRLFQDDLWTPYGIRCHSPKSPYFRYYGYAQGGIWPHDNWFIYLGLKKYGYQKEAERIKNAILGVWKKLGYMPEFYAEKQGRLSVPKRSCYPQAFSTGAIIYFLTH